MLQSVIVGLFHRKDYSHNNTSSQCGYVLQQREARFKCMPAPSDQHMKHLTCFIIATEVAFTKDAQTGRKERYHHLKTSSSWPRPSSPELKSGLEHTTAETCSFVAHIFIIIYCPQIRHVTLDSMFVDSPRGIWASNGFAGTELRSGWYQVIVSTAAPHIPLYWYIWRFQSVRN